MARTPTASPAPEPNPPLNFYGLEDLGYEVTGMSGNWLANQLDIEALCFRINHVEEDGGLGKFGHFKRYVDLLWNNPALECQKRFIWNPWAEKMLRAACENKSLSVAGCTSCGKSDPFALWAIVNYLMDPTHTKVLVMSTTLRGAKDRIWKTFKEYWSAIPNLPGKALWSTNEVQGLDYEMKGYGNSSGVYLLASEQSNEKSAMDKLIGMKAPKTQGPDGRDGNLILIIDEMTGMAESILNVVNSNLKPGNEGHFQIVGLGNPNSYFDSFGLFSQPKDGWQSVGLQDEEWETQTGGLCIRFNAEKNPRITQQNEKFSWMLSQAAIDDMARTYGRDSLYFYRMALGMWSPQGVDSGIYTQADIVQSGSMQPAVWGLQKPKLLSALDPSFTNGGDRASCTFSEFGTDPTGKSVLMRKEEVPIQIDVSNTDVPVSYQMVYAWKKECERRFVLPEDACFDATGGGIVFGDVVKTVWSSRVLGITSAGAALKEKGKDDIYANRATQIWCAPHAFFRAGQIRGVTADLAKELCSRQYDKNAQGDGRKVKVESKRVFKSREGHSPDASDSFLLTVELARIRHGFKTTERPRQDGASKLGTWASYRAKAHRITETKRLKRERE